MDGTIASYAWRKISGPLQQYMTGLTFTTWEIHFVEKMRKRLRSILEVSHRGGGKKGFNAGEVQTLCKQRMIIQMKNS